MRAEQVLGYADDALIASQRLAQWCSRAPDLEDDIALTNVALDQLGAARLLLAYAGELEGTGRGEDELAYLRDDHEFRNVLLVELPDDLSSRGGLDFGATIAKLLFLAAYQRGLYEQLAAGDDPRLAGIAAKTAKEAAYHLDYASLWTVRLGDGTDESHQRMQQAVDEIWPYTYELFDDACESNQERCDGNDLRERWLATVEPALAEATLTRPPDGGWAPRGGRRGRHTEHLSHLLAEMQVLHRAHPGARW